MEVVFLIIVFGIIFLCVNWLSILFIENESKKKEAERRKKEQREDRIAKYGPLFGSDAVDVPFFQDIFEIYAHMCRGSVGFNDSSIRVSISVVEGADETNVMIVLPKFFLERFSRERIETIGRTVSELTKIPIALDIDRYFIEFVYASTPHGRLRDLSQKLLAISLISKVLEDESVQPEENHGERIPYALKKYLDETWFS